MNLLYYKGTKLWTALHVRPYLDALPPSKKSRCQLICKLLVRFHATRHNWMFKSSDFFVTNPKLDADLAPRIFPVASRRLITMASGVKGLKRTLSRDSISPPPLKRSQPSKVQSTTTSRFVDFSL